MTTPTPSYGLLRAAEAITNVRALAMCGIAGLATFLCAALTGYLGMHSLVLAFLLSLVTIVVGLIGYSAVGIVLMRHAQGTRVEFMQAILQATFSLHRFLGVGLLLFLGYLAVLLGALVILLICKIPGLGALLYAFALPIIAVAVGLLGVGIGYVGIPLTAPAIWEGNDSFQTVARLLQIGRQRLMSVIVNMFLLSILVGFLSVVVFAILFWGTAMATAMSTAVGVGPGSGLGSMLGMLGMGMGRGYGGYGGMGMLGMGDYGSSGHLAAFSFGVGLLITIGMIIPFLTFINGTCLIYLQSIDGMDFSASEEQIRKKLEDAKQAAEKARASADKGLRASRDGTAADTAGNAPAAAAAEHAPAPAPAPAPAARSCSGCHAPLSSTDVFCGECGTKNPL